jgi:MoaA/NifB/PqqE/SkfB family radical SAM enzyme
VSKAYRQDSPNTIKVELTEGCTLSCSFCGINGIRTKPGGFKFLSLETAQRIGELLAAEVRERAWNPRIEMAMRGEPTMNPNRGPIVHALRTANPKGHIQMTSNGAGLLKGGDPYAAVQDLFDAGVNVLILDNYDGIQSVNRILSKLPSDWVRHYPQDISANPYKRRKHDEHEVVVLPDISKTDKGVHNKHELCNHGGAAGPKDYSKADKICAKPFRELVIRHDGRIPACCDAWFGQMCFGDVHTAASLDEIWQGEHLMALRRHLFHGLRIVGDCDGCNSRSTRVGLLPNKNGTGWMPEPTASDLDMLVSLAKQGPMTQPVERPWYTGLTVKGQKVS